MVKEEEYLTLCLILKKYIWNITKMSSTKEDKVDYLEVDDPIPGQNYACISFISPEALIQSKEGFKVSKFLQSYCKDKDMDINKVLKEYEDFTYKFQEEIQKDFDQQNNFQTNIRGLKVRGTYNTKEEAEKRAKSLQTVDPDFHVFVGQVGYWLPWDPCPDKIEDEYYINDQLNDMMGKYKDNNISRDIFYEEQKREKLKKAREEALQKKKEELESLKNTEEKCDDCPEKKCDDCPEKKCDDCPEEKCDDCPEKKCDDCPEEKCDDCPEENIEEDTKKDVDEITETVNTVDDDIKNSLEAIDPWMAQKMDR